VADIRDLTEADVPLIAATDGGGAWHGGEARWRGYWAEHDAGLRVALVACQADEIVGYGSLCWRSQYPPFAQAGTPDISDMVVAQRWRGRGIAARMIGALESRARAAGHSGIGIGFGLYADYGAAQRLYVRLGYVPDGRGVTYDNAPVAPGATVRLDDDLVLWLSKSLG
jgi:GNAT superfamily N-acetyltransferase